jgi:hypothetical protein
MNVMTLPADRQRHAPRSGGRTAARGEPGLPAATARAAERQRYPVAGATALAPQVQPERPPREEVPREEVPREEVPRADARLRVTPPAPVTAPRAPFVALVLVLVLVGVVGILVLNTKIAENAFRLDALHKQQSSLDRQEEQLRGDLAQKESPGYLAAQAARLGAVPTRTPAFLVLPNGTQLAMPGPAGTRK